MPKRPELPSQPSVRPAIAPGETRVPCQPCWSGDHGRCYTTPGFDCLCAHHGHPSGPFPIPDPEDT